MKRTVVLAALAALAACGQGSEEASGPDGSPYNATTERAKYITANKVAAKGPHHYQIEIDKVYYYLAGEAENNEVFPRKEGDLVQYRYLGLKTDGQYALMLVDDKGGQLDRAYCIKGCREVRFAGGHSEPLTTGSTIAAAFEDAMGNKLVSTDL